MQVADLHVSIPLSACLNVPVTGLTCLKRHLHGHSLPSGWTEHSHSTTDEASTLVFTKLAINLPLLSASATFVVRVDEDLRWTLSCHGTLVEVEQCKVLDTVQRQLCSAGAVIDLLSTLQASTICRGNPVVDFQQLVDAKGGEFQDSTGTKRPSLIIDSCIHNYCKFVLGFRNTTSS